MNKKILYVDFGGLGDHLAFSTIPKVCHENGYEFYLSNRSKFRHTDTLELVWKLNPYFKGLTNEEPNCGHGNYTNLENFNYNLSLHRNFEIKMGFENTVLENNSKYGIIYYVPKKLIEYNECILLDLHSFSQTNYNSEKIKSEISKYINCKIISIIPSYGTPVEMNDFFKTFNIEYITTKDIFNYCDLIFSCKKFICLWSGGSVLASIIKNQYKPDLEIDCFTFNTDLNWGVTDKLMFWYENINYIRI